VCPSGHTFFFNVILPNFACLNDKKNQPMIHLSVDASQVMPFLSQKDLEGIQNEIKNARDLLLKGNGPGNQFLGWLGLPSEQPGVLIDRILTDAEKIRKQSEILVVAGIGGSYLGARALIEALGDPLVMIRGKKTSGEYPLILYAGHNLSENYHLRLLETLENYSFSVVVISKSGTTTETATAFRLLKGLLEKKYGERKSRERIYAITDAERGALKQMAQTEGYSTYVLPDSVGGRFSVLSPVGLLPVAAAGINVKELLAGAKTMEEYLKTAGEMTENPAMLYAGIRNLLYRKGRMIEILVSYEPGMSFFIEWWKQLFGESEGKKHKGLFPAGAGFTTELHSLGQFIQDGTRNLFETVLSFEENPGMKLVVPGNKENLDDLNFLTGKRLQEINKMAELGTILAHVDGGVPNIRIQLPSISEETLGELIYFFEYACAVSGYTLGVNPFDQPGVEAYKKNMFTLLGKPGYEKETLELRKRLK
jgi:glucose-6-phosphate isomerase